MSNDESIDLDDVEASIEHRLRHFDDAVPLPSETPEHRSAKKPARKRRRVRARPAENIENDVAKVKKQSNDAESAVVALALVSKPKTRIVSIAERNVSGADGDVPKVVSARPDRYIPRRHQYGVESSDGKSLTRRERERSLENEKNVDASSFVERHRYEIGALGASKLSKREKRAYNDQRSKKLGIKGPKQSRIPASVLRGMRKKERERERKAQELARTTGMLTRAKRSITKRSRH